MTKQNADDKIYRTKSERITKPLSDCQIRTTQCLDDVAKPLISISGGGVSGGGGFNQQSIMRDTTAAASAAAQKREILGVGMFGEFSKGRKDP